MSDVTADLRADLGFSHATKGNGVGGYVGVGDVGGEAMLAREFQVQRNGKPEAYLDVASAPEAAASAEDPKLAEWVVPIKWSATRSREEAVKDSDFFANQNSAVKLTHGYKLERLAKAFDVEL